MAGKHGIYEKWVKGRRRKSVRLEVLTIFLIFIVIIMGVSLMIYNQNISELRQADINHLTESSKQLAYSVDSIILDVGSLFNLHYQDQRMCNIINHSKSQYDEVTRFQNTTYVEGTINHVVSNSKYIKRCCIFSANGDVYSNISSVFQDYKDYIWGIVDSGKLGRSIFYTDPEIWSIGQVDYKVVTAVKVLYSYNGTSPLAYVTLDIGYSELDRLLNSTDNPAGTLLFFEDMQIYNNRKGGLYGEQLTEVQEKAKQMVNDGHEQDILRIDGLDYLMTAIRSESSGWTVVRYVAEKEALRSITEHKIRDITVLLVTTAVVFMIYYYRIKQIMEPRAKRDEVIRHNKGTSLQKVYLSREDEWLLGNNEIRNVIQNYNSMAERINEYARKTLLYEIEQKEAQIKMLTYQINPHFLYNTLNTISAIAEIENMENIVEITDSISNIFRYNLKGDSIVTLREEIGHVKDYVQIQKYRFPDQFEMIYEIPEEIYSMKVMKFILQPLVENSISHGLFDKPEGGQITISAALTEEGDMLLTVSDNGIGINKKQLEEMNQKLFEYRVNMNSGKDFGGDGIGIINVNARVSGYYGKEYGITLYSEYGRWTRAVLRIKALRDEEPETGRAGETI